MNTPAHHPHTMAEGDTKGLYCFLNNERPCGPDCMAYTERPDSPEYLGKQWAECLLLVNAHRVGKHLTILASVGDALYKKTKTQAADEQRLNQPAPPRVK